MINVADSVSGLTLLNATLFPASLSLGQSWNIPLFSQVVEAISIENRAVGIHWVFSPELDLAREPRYGRVGEMYGEVMQVKLFAIELIANPRIFCRTLTTFHDTVLHM
jgi:beta-glucosidase-like glycosyl hydrolase